MIFLLILVHIQEARQFLHAFFLQCINKKKRILFCYKRLTIIHKRQILYNCYCTCLCMERQRTTICSLQESLVIQVFQKFIYNNWSGWCKALINHNARVDKKDETFILVPMNSNLNFEMFHSKKFVPGPLSQFTTCILSMDRSRMNL